MKRRLFKIAQQSRLYDRDLWDWTMWVKPAADCASLTHIRWVMYGLHPCYPNPNRVIRNLRDGFCLTMNSASRADGTWGSFVVFVTIALADGKREHHEVLLDLHKADGTPAPPLLPLPKTADYAESKRYFQLLKSKSAFGYAREVLAQAENLQLTSKSADLAGDSESVARINDECIWIAQQKALCTYKDPSLPNDSRLQDALRILKAEPSRLDLVSCRNTETLGLGGAIYKRLWEFDRSRVNLDLALAYYRRGYELTLERRQEPNSQADDNFDAGAFTGANVIYLCEVYACETQVEVDSSSRSERLAEAMRVRDQLAHDLPSLCEKRPGQWWLAATLLDVYLGLAFSDPEYEKMPSSRLAWPRQ